MGRIFEIILQTVRTSLANSMPARNRVPKASENVQAMGRHGKNMKKKKMIILILCIAAVLAVGIGYFLVSQSRSTDQAFSPDLDPNATALTAEGAEKPEGIRIPGYPKITVPAGETKVKMNLKNPEGNPCYFTFEIVLTETEETIYTSKMVEPGKAITEVELTRALEPGEYPAVLKIITASLEDGAEMNGADVETVLVAE